MNGKKGRLSLSGLRKRYGDFEALKGIDLDIEPQEFFALLGPSGSGKTTTLRVIAGLETADEGSLILDGVDVTEASPAERNVAMVFQNYALYPHMTVAREHRLSAADGKGAEVGNSGAGARSGATRQDRSPARPAPGQLSGRPAAALRAGPRRGAQAAAFPARRAAVQSRCPAPLETRIELKRLHSSLDVTTVYVTHDQEEAMTIADRMAIFSRRQYHPGRHARRGVQQSQQHRSGGLYRQSADESDSRDSRVWHGQDRRLFRRASGAGHAGRRRGDPRRPAEPYRSRRRRIARRAFCSRKISAKACCSMSMPAAS